MKSLSILGLEVLESVDTMQEARRSVRARGCKPSKWGWPELSQSNCFMPTLSVFCERANIDDLYLLQVYLSKTNSSQHYVAVRRRFIYDSNIVKPLSPKSFDELNNITRIVSAHCWKISKVEDPFINTAVVQILLDVRLHLLFTTD